VNTFTVTIGDQEYDVDAPDENTAWHWAQQQHYQLTPEQQQWANRGKMAAESGNLPVLGPEGVAQELRDNPQAGPFTRAYAASGNVLKQPYQSVKQLVGGDVSDADVLATRALNSGVPGVTGNLVGNAALAGTPSILGKSISIAPPGAHVLKKALTSAGVGALAGGLLEPTAGDESRLANAAIGAAGGGAVPVASRVATGLVRASPEAQALMAKGIQPTVGQGGTGFMGGVIGTVEDALESIPVAGKLVGAGRQRARNELMLEAAREASPIGEIHTVPGRGEFFKELNNQFDDAYTEIFGGKKVDLGPFVKANATRLARQALGPRATRAQINELEADLNRLMPTGKQMSAMDYKQILDNIRGRTSQHMTKADKSSLPQDENMVKAYQAAGRVLTNNRNKGLAPDVVERIEALEEKETKKRILENAAGRAREGESGTSVQNLIAATEAINPRRSKVFGTGAYQDLTDPAKKVLSEDLEKGSQTLGRRIGNLAAGGMGAAALPGTTTAAAVTALAGLTRKGSKVLFGETNPQKYAAEVLRRTSGQLTPLAAEEAVEFSR
jgi:hypothetical protein